MLFYPGHMEYAFLKKKYYNKRSLTQSRIKNCSIKKSYVKLFSFFIMKKKYESPEQNNEFAFIEKKVKIKEKDNRF